MCVKFLNFLMIEFKKELDCWLILLEMKFHIEKSWNAISNNQNWFNIKLDTHNFDWNKKQGDKQKKHTIIIEVSKSH